jgi:hypothetical protein
MNILSGVAKRWMAMVCIISFIFPWVMACDVEPPRPPQKLSFGKVMADVKVYSGQHASFEEGIVVYKQQKEDTSVVVVTTFPFPKVTTKEELADNQVLAIKVSRENYGKIQIGSRISAQGYLKEAEKKGKHIYYVNAESVTVNGQESIDDPDFSQLVDVIHQKVKDDDFVDLAIFFFIILPLLFNSFDD